MRKSIYFVAIALALPVIALFNACEPRAISDQDVFINGEASLDEILKAESPEGYKIYTLNQFLDSFMTEKGNFASDTCPYRTRATADGKIYVFSVDTIPTEGKGVYIRGRVITDDYAGNFYKSMVIQQVIDGKQQTLRISVDLGSSGGMYQLGQEILIRCNGLAVGRYANQPQLCVPSYNNNIFAQIAEQKVGWAPGRIHSAMFRKATHFIGAPDQSKIKYDTLKLDALYSDMGFSNVKKPVPALTPAGMDIVRKNDGRLVVITNVYFTGEASDNGSLVRCDTLHPDSSSLANVFAPTTNNVGYPQGRALKGNNGTIIFCSSSEYAKYATFYIPGANKHGVSGCEYYKGSITGILGWYQDNASKLNSLTGYEWSVTPRGIPGIGISDIHMVHELTEKEWVPVEFDPKDYH